MILAAVPAGRRRDGYAESSELSWPLSNIPCFALVFTQFSLLGLTRAIGKVPLK